MNQELIMMFNGEESVRLSADAVNDADGVIAAFYNDIQQNMQTDSSRSQIVVIDEAQNIVASNFAAYKDMEGFKIEDGTTLVQEAISQASDIPTNGMSHGNLIIMDDGTTVSLTDENGLKNKNIDITDLLESNGLVPATEEALAEPEGEKQYQLWECPKCTALFRDKDICELHVVQAHDFKCGLCEEPFQEKEDLENHIIKHISEVPGHSIQIISRSVDGGNESKVNSTETPGTQELKNSSETREQSISTSQNSNNAAFICSTCGLSFLSTQHLAEHELTHADEDSSLPSQGNEQQISVPEIASSADSESNKSQLTCNVCDKLFYSKNGLLLHMNKKHCASTSDSYICDECGEEFELKHLLENHLLCQHSQKRGCLSCSICHKGFFTAETLAQHLSSHEQDENLFPCDTCGEKFKQSAALLNHIKLTHPNLQEFSCDECGKSFKIKKFLEAHISEVHAHKDGNRCRICRKTFMSTSSFLTHMVIHQNNPSENPQIAKSIRFVCDICGALFQSPGELNVHANLHTNYAEGTIMDET